ncbi:MAG: SRPBCC family protein [Hyphomicrobiales bacterium]|nr:SRPBCC family protein [Hyphomicrobiales bacterium]
MRGKIIRRVAIGIVAVLVVAVVVAFFLPRYPAVSRSIDIAASPSAVFPLVGDLRRFNEWSPWFSRDPDATYTFTGPTEGVGQTLRWESDVPEVGSGTMTVASIAADEGVVIDLDFGDRGPANTSITLAPDGDGTRVTWGFVTDLGFNPIARYFGSMIADVVGADYDTGLAKLKTVVEQPPEESVNDE